MTTTKKTESQVLPVLREMAIGESVMYPLERRSYLSSACVRFGLEWEKKFETKTDSKNRTVTVTRVE